MDLESHESDYNEMKIGKVESGVLSGQFRNLERERDGRKRVCIQYMLEYKSNYVHSYFSTQTSKNVIVLPFLPSESKVQSEV